MPQSKKPIYRFCCAMSQMERENLKAEYIHMDKSAEEIAGKLGVSVRLIYTRLKEHGIAKKHPGTGIKRKPKKPKYCRTCGQVIQAP